MSSGAVSQLLVALLVLFVALDVVTVLPYVLVRWRERFSPRDFAQQAGAGGDFMTIDHHEVHYVDEGPRDGIPVVLVHGFGAWSFAWRLQRIALVNAGFRVISFDELGSGASARPHGPVYTTAYQAEIFLGIMDGLGVRAAHLVGHSYGGRLAMLVAIKAPARVLTLTGIDPEAFSVGRPPMAFALRLPVIGFAFAFYATAPFLIRPFMKAVAKTLDWFSIEIEKGYQAPVFVRGTAMSQVWQARSLKDGDISVPENLARITQPTLLIWGSADAVFPASDGEKLLAILPTAQLHVIEGAGHVPYEEKPDELNGVLLAFLSAHPRSIGANA